MSILCFFNDLVAKMILFRAADYAIPRSEWYKAEKGLKAEVVTYTLALLRYSAINLFCLLVLIARN